MEPDIEVAQKANLVRLIQQSLEALNTAPTQYKAAMHVARIYHTLSGLRRIDEGFQDEWGAVLDGRFAEIVGSEDEWLDLSWNDVWAAYDVLLHLMDRHGMGFQALLHDDVEANEGQDEVLLDDEPREPAEDPDE